MFPQIPLRDCLVESRNGPANVEQGRLRSAIRCCSASTSGGSGTWSRASLRKLPVTVARFIVKFTAEPGPADLYTVPSEAAHNLSEWQASRKGVEEGPPLPLAY